MDPNQFIESQRSHVIRIGLGNAWAFIPPGLPPDIRWDGELVAALSLADHATGELAGMARTLANPHLISGLLMNREVVLSSRIEGTQASVRDVLLFDVDPSVENRVPDVQEVINYSQALHYGLRRLNDFPLSLRLIQELHERLMHDVRGQQRAGQWRTQQVHIGFPGSKIEEARYVPPPLDRMSSALHQLEQFIVEDNTLPPLIKIALTHCQFEAIHPFSDGNGRIGRLLITLMLCTSGLMPHPLMYLSDYFERTKQSYYELLLRVSTQDDWHSWLVYFLNGVRLQAGDATSRCKRLLELHAQYRAHFQAPKSSGLMLKAIDHIFQSPYTSARQMERILGVSSSTAKQYLDRLLSQAILVEVTGGKRNRVFAAQEVLAVLEDDNPET